MLVILNRADKGATVEVVQRNVVGLRQGPEALQSIPAYKYENILDVLLTHRIAPHEGMCLCLVDNSALFVRPDCVRPC